MPYIKERTWINDRIEGLLKEFDHDANIQAGEVNYIVTRIVNAFLGRKPNYDRFNAAVGILECAKLELYRRRIAPYEDKKRDENGDVY